MLGTSSQSLNPTSTFLQSPKSTGEEVSPTRERSSSQETLVTIYSMYGDASRSKTRSCTPPNDDDDCFVAQFDACNHPPALAIRRASALSTESSELPYATPESDPEETLKPPRPPRALHPLTSRPATAPARRMEQDKRKDLTSSVSDRRSYSLASLDQSHTPPRPALRTPLLLEKPTPPTPPDSPSSPSNVTVPPRPADTDVGSTELEDPDSYYIRNVYAQLDVIGVSGDGYEDGIERTRARLNPESTHMSITASRRHYLNKTELELLGRLDRYGFYSPPLGERRVLLPRAKHLTLYRHLESSALPSPSPLNTQPPPRAPEKERSRISKWQKMMLPMERNSDSWFVNPTKEKKLRQRVYKGIPDRWRSAVWDTLISRLGHSPHRDYHELLEEPSDYDIQIDLDVPRTISGHVMFRTRYGQGQRDLFHVLHSFSLHCSHCGYCQGMGPIAATFLCYANAEKAHEWMCQLHTAYAMDKIFRPGFPGLLENIFLQEKITQRFMPGIYASFKRHMISTTAFATKWYITLFANSIPFQTQLRLWDAFLLEGMDTIIIMAIAVVWALKDRLVSKAASFETVLSLLSSFFEPEDEDDLMDWISTAMRDSKLRYDMSCWRKEWNDLVERGEEGSALL